MNRKRLTSAGFGVVALALALTCTASPFALCQATSTSHDAVKKTTSPLTSAKAQLAHGDLQGAETSLWSVLSADPNNVEALSLLGETRMRQLRLAEAEALFRRVVQIDPKSVAGHRRLGQVLGTQDKVAEAIEQYQAAAELAPKDVELQVELAHMYARSGQFGQVITILEAIPATRLPVDAIPVEAAGLIAVGRKREAIALIERAKSSPAAELDLAEVYVDGKLPDEALRSLEFAAAGIKRRPARFYYLKGRALASKSDTTGAMSALRQAIAEDPKAPDAQVALAEMYSEQNKHAEAVEALQKARVLNPESLAVLRHLVVEATRASDRKAALDAASVLADKSPNNPDDLYLAGAAMLEQNVQGASTVLEKYVSLRPDNAKAWMGLGIAYVQQEHYAQARKPLERAIELDSSLAEAEYELGIVAKNEAKADEAIRHLQRAVELQPSHVGALRTLGNLYLQSGELEKAGDSLERAEALAPNNSQTEYDLGLVYNKLGKAELARQHMEQFRKLKAAETSDRHD